MTVPPNRSLAVPPIALTIGARLWPVQVALAWAACLVSAAACTWLWLNMAPPSSDAAAWAEWLRGAGFGLALLAPLGLIAMVYANARRERASVLDGHARQASQRRAWLDLLDLLPVPVAVAVAVCGKNEGTVAPNRALRHLLGAEDGAAAPLAFDWLQIVAAEDQAAWTACVTAALATRQPQWLKCTVQLAGSAQEVLAQLASFGAEDEAQLVVSLTLSQTQAGLAQDTVLKLRVLLELAEAEKWHFGQAVHDELGQRLSGMAYFSKALERKLQTAQRLEAEDAAWLTRLSNETMAAARGLARGLVPVGSEDRGALAMALTELCERAGKTFDIVCALQVDSSFDAGGAARASHLYHAIQELVTNAVKHGRAQRLQVSLEVLDSCQRVTVRNDGQALGQAPTRHGMGVNGVRSRVAYLGGQFTLANGSPGGVVATIELSSATHLGADPAATAGSTHGAVATAGAGHGAVATAPEGGT
jgi:signal transduction histidine kinase